MRRPIVCVVLLTALSALAATPAPAPAADRGWTRLDVPFTFLPQAAGLHARAGRQLLTYWDNPVGQPAAQHRMRIMERVPGAAFSAPQEIASTFLSGADFADNGDGVVVENSFPGTRTRFRPVGGPPASFGASAADHRFMNVNVNASGAALAAVQTTGDRLRVSDRPAGAGSAFAPFVQTDNDETVVLQSGVFPPFLVPILDASGAAVVVFGSTGDQVKAVSRPVAGTFGPAVTLPIPAGTYPRAAMNQAGDAVLMWAQSGVVKASYRPRGGTFGPAESVFATPSDGTTIEDGPNPAVDGSGRVFAAWHTQRPGTYTCDALDRRRMRTAFRDTAGGWSVKADRPGQQTAVAGADTADAAAARFVLTYERPDPRLAGCPETTARRIVGEVVAFGETGTPEVLPGQAAGDGINHNRSVAITPAGEALALFESDINDGEAVAYEGGASKDEEPPVDNGTGGDKTGGADKTGGTGGVNNAPAGFTGTGPSGARIETPGAQVGGTLAVDPRINTPVPPPVRVSQLDQGISLTVSCVTACGLTITGQVQTGGGRARAAARLALKAVKVSLKAGERKRIRVKLPKKAIAAVKRAVRRRQRAVAVLRITAPGAAPKTVTVKFKR